MIVKMREKKAYSIAPHKHKKNVSDKNRKKSHKISKKHKSHKNNNKRERSNNRPLKMTQNWTSNGPVNKNNDGNQNRGATTDLIKSR